MEYWNYRVLKRRSEYSNTYGIHEVFYNDEDGIESWTEHPVCPMGESVGELMDDIVHFLAAFSRPVLAVVEYEETARLIQDNGHCDAHGCQYQEVVDRAAVLMGYFEHFVASHNAVKMNERIASAAQKTLDALYEFYGAAVEGREGRNL